MKLFFCLLNSIPISVLELRPSLQAQISLLRRQDSTQKSLTASVSIVDKDLILKTLMGLILATLVQAARTLVNPIRTLNMDQVEKTSVTLKSLARITVIQEVFLQHASTRIHKQQQQATRRMTRRSQRRDKVMKAKTLNDHRNPRQMACVRFSWYGQSVEAIHGIQPL